MSDEQPAISWVDPGHLPGPLPDDLRVQHGKVAIDVATGDVIQPQPEYPSDPEPAPTSEPKETS